MLTIKDGEFKMNGESFRIYSGSMHYFRIMPEYWEDRLKKLKAAGFNTVETYVCWNMHEPKRANLISPADLTSGGSSRPPKRSDSML